MFLPFPFQGIYRESGLPGYPAEQLPSAFKKRFQCRTQQRFPETPGPRQEKSPAGTGYQLVNPGGFVNVTKAFFADTCKILYAYG